MNVGFVFWILGKLVFIEGLLLVPSALVGLIYGEYFQSLNYFMTAVGLVATGALSFVFKPQSKILRAREGLAIAGLGWIAVSLFGALPLTLCSEANYIDAFFEIVSGFTTTGATIFREVETLCHCTMFWRSFTHWIGGMGVLVFVMAILSFNDSRSMHIMRAEVPGHQAGKLVSKMQVNSRILYLIYVSLTVVEFVLLVFGGMDIFDSMLNSFATAGTGGFGIKNLGIGQYQSVWAEWVITVFMLLFSINFNLYYFILIGSWREALKSEELKWFGGIVAFAVISVTINVLPLYESLSHAFRDVSFSVASLISTTGFATANFDLWPDFSKVVLVGLMFIGACSGSTGGGIKVSRIVIMIKTAIAQVKKQVSPRSVQTVKFEKKLVDSSLQSGIMGYLTVYICVFVVSLAIISLDSFSMVTSFTSVTACLNNIGPGLETVGPMGNYADMSVLSKLVLSFDMLAGRLELFPMLSLLYPGAWRK